MITNLLSSSEINELFTYDGSNLFWRDKASNVAAGALAGSINNKGYLCVQVAGTLYKVHNLVWILHGNTIPDGCVVDHVNRIRNDNRICNLRIATYTENNVNSKISCRNTSGFKGVNWNKQSNSWRASIRVNGRAKYLGNFSTPEEASEAYTFAAEILYGEFVVK